LRPSTVAQSKWAIAPSAIGWLRCLTTSAATRSRSSRSDGFFDLGWTLLACVRSLVVAQLVLTSLLALLCLIMAPGPVSDLLFLTVSGLVAVHALTFLAAAVRLGLNRRRLGLLCHAPRIIAQLLFIASKSAIGGQPVSWERTPR